MRTIKFAVGFAAGYVLGAWAGRDKYEQIVTMFNQAINHPAVTETQQAVKDTLSQATDHAPATEPALQAVTESDASTEDVPVIPKRRGTQATVTAPSVTADPVPDI